MYCQCPIGCEGREHKGQGERQGTAVEPDRLTGAGPTQTKTWVSLCSCCVLTLSISPCIYTYIHQHLQCHFGAAWSSNYVTALSFICLPSSIEQCGFAKATRKSHKKGYPPLQTQYSFRERYLWKDISCAV